MGGENLLSGESKLEDAEETPDTSKINRRLSGWGIRSCYCSSVSSNPNSCEEDRQRMFFFVPCHGGKGVTTALTPPDGPFLQRWLWRCWQHPCPGGCTHKCRCPAAHFSACQPLSWQPLLCIAKGDPARPLPCLLGWQLVFLGFLPIDRQEVLPGSCICKSYM